MEVAADLLARHALTALLCITLLMLTMTAISWHVIATYGPRMWSLAARSWHALGNSAPVSLARRVPGLHRTFARTLTVARYLGIHAILSFLLALACVIAFVELADEIGFDEDIARFDLALSQALATHAGPALLQTMSWITLLGNKEFLIPLGAVVTVVLLLKRERLLACVWAIATASGALLNELLKSIFQRVRPIHDHGILSADGWSFPSGHAAGSMLVYGLLGYVVIRHTPQRWHIPVAIVCVTLIVFVGFSRILLQVHYLSDVIAGYASATAWGACCVAGLEAVRRQTAAP